MQILTLRDNPEWRQRMIDFCCMAWHVNPDEYEALTAACLAHPDGIPQFYLIADGQRIAACADVQENDEHDRPDLRPNICDVFVLPEYRGHQLAQQLLSFIEQDMAQRGEHTLYLLTELNGFYERYGWQQCATAHWYWLGGKPSKVYKRES